MLIVLTTVPDIAQAEQLAEAIINANLAACVQILPPMTSVYIWDGKVCREAEHLMLIKTLPAKYEELEAHITNHHSYEVPEIVAIETAKISEPYLQWIQQVMS